MTSWARARKKSVFFRTSFIDSSPLPSPRSKGFRRDSCAGPKLVTVPPSASPVARYSPCMSNTNHWGAQGSAHTLAAQDGSGDSAVRGHISCCQVRMDSTIMPLPEPVMPKIIVWGLLSSSGERNSGARLVPCAPKKKLRFGSW